MLAENGKVTANGMVPRMGVARLCPEVESINLVADGSALGLDSRVDPRKSVANGVRAGKGSWVGPKPLVNDGMGFTLRVGAGS